VLAAIESCMGAEGYGLTRRFSDLSRVCERTYTAENYKWIIII